MRNFYKIILSNYIYSYNQKTYKVDDIKWEENPSTKFPIRKEDMPLHQYYKKVIKVYDARML